MSRPLVEPTTPRTLGRQGFSINQLQRRPAQIGVAEFGVTSQDIYLPRIGNAASNDEDVLIGPSMSWVFDAAAPGSGYVTRNTPADLSYFSFMVNLWPKGSIWSFHFVYGQGPDFGKFDMSIASLLYESPERPSGCSQGKIQSYDASYGDNPVYFVINPQQDGYAAAPGYTPLTGQVNLEVGGDIGAPLTDLTDVGNPCADNTGVDPMNGCPIMDGGPGWYRVRIQVNGKNASSSDYRMRICQMVCSRVDDSLVA